MGGRQPSTGGMNTHPPTLFISDPYLIVAIVVPDQHRVGEELQGQLDVRLGRLVVVVSV